MNPTEVGRTYHRRNSNNLSEVNRSHEQKRNVQVGRVVIRRKPENSGKGGDQRRKRPDHQVKAHPTKLRGGGTAAN